MDQKVEKEFKEKNKNESIIDFSQIRKKKIALKRRSIERLFFKNHIAVYALVEVDQLYKIEVIDVSEEGCSFRIPFEKNEETAVFKGPCTFLSQFEIKKSDLPIRFYFSEKNYLEILIQIRYSTDFIEDGCHWIRFGCSVNQTFRSYKAYEQFIRFLKSYAEYAHSA